METADDEKTLLRLQGQVVVLKIIAGMPAQVLEDLKRMDEEDKLKAVYNKMDLDWEKRPGVFSVKGDYT